MSIVAVHGPTMLGDGGGGGEPLPEGLTITSLTPNTASASTSGLVSVAVVGTGFTYGTILLDQTMIHVDGVGAYSTTIQSDTQLTSQWNPSILGVGTHMITAFHEDQLSNELPFTVTA